VSISNQHNICRKGKIARSIIYSFGIIFGLLVLVFPVELFTQSIVITGRVVDASNGEPIPFANIIVTGTLEGTLTDLNGNYLLELGSNNNDSIRASLLGYKQTSQLIPPGSEPTINFKLVHHNQDLPEVIITYEGNPADAIMDSIVKYKERSTFQGFAYTQYDSYTKANVGVNNLDEEFFEKKLWEPFAFIQDYKDTSVLNGKEYIPVMISETRSTIYERRSPRSKKEVIHASRVSGLEHTNVSQFLGNMTMEVMVYKNHIDLFEKNFISPLANNGHDYYRYYLLDSAFIDNKWCYHLRYKPRRKQELTFSGDLWVNDTSWALVSIKMRMASDANLNFVNDLSVEQEFRWTDDNYWMITKDRMVIDLNLVKNSSTIIGANGERINYYSNFLFDTIDTPGVFNDPKDVTIRDNALQLNEAYWDSLRPEALSETEEGIYEMVDSVKNSPSFKKYKTIATGIVSGYFELGKFELGPYFKLFSYNAIEGARFRIGGRTSPNLSKKFRVGAYLAYGVKDDRFKYGTDFIYLFNKNYRRALYFSFKYDLEQLGLSTTGRPTDNILSSFFARGPIDKLTFVREYKLSYEYEWFTGLINTAHLHRRELFPPGDTEFLMYPDTRQDTVFKNSITTTEIGLDTRISFKEKYIDGRYNRLTINSEYPIIDIRYRFGIPHAKVNDYNYHKLNISVSQWFNLGMIGWSRFYVDWGKIWGTIPYPLLKIHDGNETWIFDQYSANMMNYYEFISDHYVTFYYTHHFDGLLFNKIPLLRRLELREVIHFRGLYGSVTQKNLEFSEYPGNLRPFGNEPYLEAGVGLENIIKFFRVDAIWRLTHLNDPGNDPVSKFGIFASLYFSF
jgi:hypothetical protein